MREIQHRTPIGTSLDKGKRNERQHGIKLKISLRKWLCFLLVSACVLTVFSYVVLWLFVSYSDEVSVLRRQAIQFISSPVALNCTLGPYPLMYHKTVQDRPHGSCETLPQKHTLFNSDSGSFTMKCPGNMVALYRDTPFFVFYANIVKWENLVGWKLYPTERILEMNSESLWPHTFPSNVPIYLPNRDLIHTVCVDMERGVSHHEFYTKVVKDHNRVKKRKKLMNRHIQQLHNYLNSNEATRDSASSMNRDVTKPMDIHILLIDSASRQFFDRHFPHTKQALNEIRSKHTDKIEIVEFSNYHVLASNSGPNMHAFVTSESWTPRSYYPYFFRLISGITLKKTLWDYLKDIGYVTSAGEDAHVSPTTSGTYYGYMHQFLSCDIYPVYHRVSHIVHNFFKWKFNYGADKCPCVGGRAMSSLVLEFVRSQLTTYTEVPNFILAAHHEAHDMYGYQTLFLDPDISSYLRWLEQSGRLFNTAILLMADHGAHYGPLYHENLTQALLEHASPYASLILPKHVAQNTKLLLNKDKLVSLKDFHLTIRDIATYPMSSTRREIRRDAQSLLFDAIPPDRTCSDMGVLSQFDINCPETIKT